MKTPQLVQFIKDHGHDAFESEGRISASCTLLYPDGCVRTEWEFVDANLQAVRDWLGY